MQNGYVQKCSFAFIVFMVLVYPLITEVNGNTDTTINNEVEMDTIELSSLQGYSAEKHTVNTEDGYQLDIYRIPHGKNNVSTADKISVLLMHGIFQSPNAWIDNLDDSLGFVLANEQYDVWLGSIRGNKGTQHLTYTKKDAMFWNYSWDEMAEYDAPAIIDYIRDRTKQQKILLVGYSLGTIIGFATLTSKPEFNDKVVGFVALAPAFTYRYTCDLMFQTFVNKLQPVLRKLKYSQFTVTALITAIGLLDSYIPGTSKYVMTYLSGYGTFESGTREPIYLQHTTESTSVKLLHHMQQLSHGKITKFDYGKEKNVMKYGRITPPEYNANNIRIPVALFASNNDALVGPIDVAIAKRMLNTVIAYDVISEPMFNHANFVWLHPSRPILYDKVIAVLRRMWELNGPQQD